jgi:hypothetical protein
MSGPGKSCAIRVYQRVVDSVAEIVENSRLDMSELRRIKSFPFDTSKERACLGAHYPTPTGPSRRQPVALGKTSERKGESIHTLDRRILLKTAERP